MPNSLDPDQARQNVGSDLVPNFLQMLTVEFEYSSRLRAICMLCNFAYDLLVCFRVFFCCFDFVLFV